MPFTGRKLEPPRSVGRRRVVPVKPTEEVETAVPEVQGAFVVRHNYGSKSALDHPGMPLFRSMGPGTPEWHKTVTILPIDPPNKNLVNTFNATQRSLAHEYKKQASELGGPLISPRMSMPVPPATARPSTRSREGDGTTPSGGGGISLILDGTQRLSTPRSARESDFNTTETGLPPLFTGGRTKAQHRHLLAVNQEGERFKPIAAAPPPAASPLVSAHGSIIVGTGNGGHSGTTSRRLGSHGPTSTLLPPSHNNNNNRSSGFDDHLSASSPATATVSPSSGGFGGKPSFGTAANTKEIHHRTPGSRGATPPPQHLHAPPALGGLAPALLPKSTTPHQSSTGGGVTPVSLAAVNEETNILRLDGGAAVTVSKPDTKPSPAATPPSSSAQAPILKEEEDEHATANAGAVVGSLHQKPVVNGGGEGGPIDPPVVAGNGRTTTPSTTTTNTPVHGGLGTQSVDDTASQLSYAAKQS